MNSVMFLFIDNIIFHLMMPPPVIFGMFSSIVLMLILPEYVLCSYLAIDSVSCMPVNLSFLLMTLSGNLVPLLIINLSYLRSLTRSWIAMLLGSVMIYGWMSALGLLWDLSSVRTQVSLSLGLGLFVSTCLKNLRRMVCMPTWSMPSILM